MTDSRRRRVLLVVGTRPNFMKTAPIASALAARPAEFEPLLVHTGQHYDAAMSDVFLDELGIGRPDRFLAVGSGTHAQQTARVMERMEEVLLELSPDVVVVPGDVNSTMAATLAAAKLEIPVAHVEAGLRSFDRSMPEELNRVVTDALAQLLFIHSPEARDNLLAEGRPEAGIHYVGNTMIDTLVAMRPRVEAARDATAAYGLPHGGYLLVTLHRPALVDTPLLGEAMAALAEVSRELPVLFPVHPRTAEALKARAPSAGGAALQLVEPVGYLEFLGLMAGAAAVLTDSGGIQEEATYLGVPCFTLRENTERPVTVELGTNTLLGLRPDRILELPGLLERSGDSPATVPPLWDGRAAERIADVLADSLPGPEAGYRRATTR